MCEASKVILERQKSQKSTRFFNAFERQQSKVVGLHLDALAFLKQCFDNYGSYRLKSKRVALTRNWDSKVKPQVWRAALKCKLEKRTGSYVVSLNRMLWSCKPQVQRETLNCKLRQQNLHRNFRKISTAKFVKSLSCNFIKAW